jgi:hypothetical protein
MSKLEQKIKNNPDYCNQFRKDPTVNPTTGFSIKEGKGTYNDLIKLCDKYLPLSPRRTPNKPASPYQIPPPIMASPKYQLPITNQPPPLITIPISPVITTPKYQVPSPLITRPVLPVTNQPSTTYQLPPPKYQLPPPIITQPSPKYQLPPPITNQPSPKYQLPPPITNQPSPKYQLPPPLITRPVLPTITTPKYQVPSPLVTRPILPTRPMVSSVSQNAPTIALTGIDEVDKLILMELDTDSLINATLVDKRINRLVNTDFWKERLLEKYGLKNNDKTVNYKTVNKNYDKTKTLEENLRKAILNYDNDTLKVLLQNNVDVSTGKSERKMINGRMTYISGSAFELAVHGTNYEAAKLLLQNPLTLIDISIYDYNGILSYAIKNHDLSLFQQLANDKRFVNPRMFISSILGRILPMNEVERREFLISFLASDGFLLTGSEFIGALQTLENERDRDSILLLLESKKNPLTVTQTNDLITLVNQEDFDFNEILEPRGRYLLKVFLENPDYQLDISELNTLLFVTIRDEDIDTVELLLDDVRMNGIHPLAGEIIEVIFSNNPTTRYNMFNLLLSPKYAQRYGNIEHYLLEILEMAAIRGDKNLINLVLNDNRLDITDDDRASLKRFNNLGEFVDLVKYLHNNIL